MVILSIDPGIDTGWAILVNGELTNAGLGDPRTAIELLGLRLGSVQVVIECPRIYPHGSKGDPNGLITLAVMVGEYKEYCESRGARVELVFPAQWKGQCPKSVTEKRVRAQFPGVDKWLVGVAPSKRHNVIDSIGLAVWAAKL